MKRLAACACCLAFLIESGLSVNKRLDIQKRIQPYVEFELLQEQAGSRKGGGTRNHIANCVE